LKERKQLKKWIICISMVAIELLLYYGISGYMDRYFRTETEFLRTIDCAPLFDSYPSHSFELEFEIRTEKPGEVLVYQMNSSKHRYSFSQKIETTEEFKKISLIVEPILTDEEESESYLSFYGLYGSGVIPTVRNISIRVIE